MGMKREAVQEERQRTKDHSEVESTSNLQVDMPLDRIVEAEKRVECNEVSASLEVNIRGILLTSVTHNLVSQSKAITSITK